MIKINELRIGNYLQNEIDKSLLVVCGLRENEIMTTVSDRSKYPLPIGWKAQPIPLTVDCIKKFEFFEEYSSSKGKGCFQKKFINITIADNGFYCYCGDCRRHISITLHHVHQLQNLYFALTGEELTMK